jgi:hypothetical protein
VTGRGLVTAHTDAELARLVSLVTSACPRHAPAAAVSVGHGRDAASRAAAQAFVAAWSAIGEVVAVVDWPETAASWLRPATRLTAQAPDAWVVAAAPAGFARLARRLRDGGGWDPARTVAFASVRDPAVVARAGHRTLDGLHGATRDGGTWCVRGDCIVEHPAPAG